MFTQRAHRKNRLPGLKDIPKVLSFAIQVQKVLVAVHAVEVVKGVHSFRISSTHIFLVVSGQIFVVDTLQ